MKNPLPAVPWCRADGRVFVCVLTCRFYIGHIPSHFMEKTSSMSERELADQSRCCHYWPLQASLYFSIHSVNAAIHFSFPSNCAHPVCPLLSLPLCSHQVSLMALWLELNSYFCFFPFVLSYFRRAWEYREGGDDEWSRFGSDCGFRTYLSFLQLVMCAYVWGGTCGTLIGLPFLDTNCARHLRK